MKGISIAFAIAGLIVANPVVFRADAQEPTENNRAGTLLFSAGMATLNSFDSQRDVAWSIAYQYPIFRYIGWSLEVLNEGHLELTRRDGLASELWLGARLLDDRLLLQAGAGPYLYADTVETDPDEDGSYRDDHGIYGLVSLAAQYDISKPVCLRFTWHRVATDDHRDTDLVLLGLGWNFYRR
ncbi:MAG TPA: hypothetical protein DCZ95_02445 [Verrucomicrobia bacterium]|nr:MAG: hypothetical protein A2X46_00405 [Lentisphaerae bacterium GWF2_57_35]HBA82932.1 hypothetical protein [Verrucomicrobiota bacterium]